MDQVLNFSARFCRSLARPVVNTVFDSNAKLCMVPFCLRRVPVLRSAVPYLRS